MDIREIQRLHEQFAHAQLTIEATVGTQHSANRMLPPPVYAAAGASRRWETYNRSALLIGGIVAGMLVAGAIGMSLANWQHRREADAEIADDAAPATAQVNPQAPDPAQPPVPVQTIMNPAATPPAASAPRTEMTQSAELSPNPAPPKPAAQPPMPVTSAPRPQSSEAPARHPSPGLRKAEPTPAQTKPAPPAARAQHGIAATDIKLF